MKHGEMYIAEDGREMLVVGIPAELCHNSEGVQCEIDSCSFDNPKAWPCKGEPIIFVNKEQYLKYKLLGTAESSS